MTDLVEVQSPIHPKYISRCSRAFWTPFITLYPSIMVSSPKNLELLRHKINLRLFLLQTKLTNDIFNQFCYMSVVRVRYARCVCIKKKTIKYCYELLEKTRDVET